MTDFFITGANGFIGRALSSHLRERGDVVTGVDLTSDPAHEVFAGDLTEPNAWVGRIPAGAIVVHTAALVSNLPTLAEAWRVNTLGTRRVLDAAVAAGASRFVHVSSVRAFSDLGFPDGVTEAHPLRPDGNPYVDTRIAAEQAVLQAHAAGEIACTIVRPGDVYGPGSRPWTILPVEMIRANRCLLPAMGRGIFSPVYVDDLVAGIALAAQQPAGVGQVFTLSGQALEHRKVLDIESGQRGAQHVGRGSNQIVGGADRGMARSELPAEFAGTTRDHLRDRLRAKRCEQCPRMSSAREMPSSTARRSSASVWLSSRQMLVRCLHHNTHRRAGPSPRAIR